MKKIVSLILVLGLLIGAMPTYAADWYRIEVLVFARGGPSSGDNEHWPQTSGILDWEQARIGNYSDSPRGSWRLTGAKQRLKRDGMTPLIHRAWAQPVYRRNNARSVYLRSGREITPGVPNIEGMIKVSVNRYLHAEFDLLLRRQSSDTELLPGSFKTYRFKQRRRMRSKELHYIDHPLMGVLIEILPIESAKKSTGSDKEEAADKATAVEGKTAE